MWSLRLRPHPVAGVQEQEAEDVDRPVEGLDDRSAEADEDGPEHDRAEDPVEEHPVLVLERDDEGREDQREDEDVVDRQAELEQVAGEVRCAILGAAGEEDEHPEGQAQRDVEGAEDRGFAERRGMRLSVEDEQVQRQDRADRDGEDDPQDGVGVQSMSLRAWRYVTPKVSADRAFSARPMPAGPREVVRGDAAHPGPGVLPLGSSMVPNLCAGPRDSGTVTAWNGRRVGSLSLAARCRATTGSGRADWQAQGRAATWRPVPRQGQGQASERPRLRSSRHRRRYPRKASTP